jgi:hypothetical protein
MLDEITRLETEHGKGSFRVEEIMTTTKILRED